MFTRPFPAIKEVLPARRTVTSDLKLVYQLNVRRLIGHYKAHDSAFHIAVDGWTNRAQDAFLDVHCLWNVVEGSEVTPRSMLIDFIQYVNFVCDDPNACTKLLC